MTSWIFTVPISYSFIINCLKFAYLGVCFNISKEVFFFNNCQYSILRILLTLIQIFPTQIFVWGWIPFDTFLRNCPDKPLVYKPDNSFFLQNEFAWRASFTDCLWCLHWYWQSSLCNSEGLRTVPAIHTVIWTSSE